MRLEEINDMDEEKSFTTIAIKKASKKIQIQWYTIKLI